MSRLLALTLASFLVACSTEAPSPEAESAPDPNLSTTHVTPEAAAAIEAAATENVAIETATADAASDCSVSLSISGMVCDKMCPPKVETALGAVDGVAKVEVTYPDSAKVFGNGAACSEEGQPTLLKALEAAGFGGAILNAS